MRIDHHAYQRATRVAGFGLLVQIVIGVLLFLFGSIGHDTASVLASFYVLPGVLVWLGLIIIFHQHKLERLEALEEDELAATRGGAGTFFDRAGGETRVAARRLSLMHKWLMPGLSLLLAAVLAGLAILIWRYMDRVGGSGDFRRTDERGWAVAICLFFAAMSFVFSRFVAGMAKQQAWQNLRGGAAYMVGNALVMVAVATGIIFRFFENERVIEGVGYAIAVFMTLLVVEIILNFILNLYRPRIPGEVPRPAFDSKTLSLVATPDSIVRTLNEAVNYQFGFDVTSSWGYQLLLRSCVSLLVLGTAALVLLSTMVIIEPHQQAVKLRGGRIVDDHVYQSGVMWKWPWPFETAAVYDVTRVQSLHLTAKVIDNPNIPPDKQVNVWDKSEPPKTDIEIEPFIVGSQAAGDVVHVVSGGDLSQPSDEDRAAAISDNYSLVDAEIVLEYRIRPGGLIDYLQFAPQTMARRQTLTDCRRALKALALAEVSRQLAQLSLDDVLASGRVNWAGDLAAKIQASFDKSRTGVEVVAVSLPMLRPSGETAPKFEELNISTQARLERIAKAQSLVVRTFATRLGDASLTDQVLAAIDEYDALKARLGPTSPQTVEQHHKVVQLLRQGGGTAAQQIAAAENERWVKIMSNRAQAQRVVGQLAAYRAAPELYRQRETMKVLKNLLPLKSKYIIAIDPSHISIDCDLKQINPILEFAGASEEEKNKQ